MFSSYKNSIVNFVTGVHATLFTHGKTTSYTHLPQQILENLENSNHAEAKSALNAFYYNRDHFPIKIDELNETTLAKLANTTNCSFVHLSGNCWLLASALFYNLKIGRGDLAVGNTFPPYLGTGGIFIEKILFGKELTLHNYLLKTVNALIKELLEIFSIFDERVYLINAEYDVPLLGKFGHVFNAVIVGDSSTPKVLFVDAWKTSCYIQTPEGLKTRYPNTIFAIKYHRGPFQPLQKPEQEAEVSNRQAMKK